MRDLKLSKKKNKETTFAFQKCNKHNSLKSLQTI